MQARKSTDVCNIFNPVNVTVKEIKHYVTRTEDLADPPMNHQSRYWWMVLSNMKWKKC